MDGAGHLRPELGAEPLRETLDALREGIQVLSPEWRYLYVNEATARHGRKPREALLGRTMLECYPGIEQTHVFSVLQRCMRERRAESLENAFRYEDGQVCWFELRIEPCPEGLVVLSLDVTDRKRLERELRQAEKLRALGQMAACVVHDLNNMLNPLVLGVKLLRRRAGTDTATAEEVLDGMEETIRTGSETVERLRGFSRHEPEDAVVPADLERGADTAIAICLPRIQARGGVELRRQRGEPPPVLVHAAELTTAIVNLVLNALEALPSAGTIAVRTGSEGGGGWIEVADDGPGMPPEVEGRAFEPFFTTKAEGTGLGLAQVYALVQRHRGRVALDTGPARGTTLRLWFPAAVEKRAAG